MKCKAIILILLMALVMSVPALALTPSSATLGWTAYSERTLITGFRVYASTTSGQYAYGPASSNLVTGITDPTSVTIKYTPAKPGKLYMVITAYSATAESGPSNKISVDVKLSAPLNFLLTVDPASGQATIAPAN
jgi:hypothetical protein